MFLTRPCFWWQTRGAEIHLRVKELLDVLLARLKDIECGQTRRSVLAAVGILGGHQRDAIASALLARSLPHDDDIADCWRTLAADPSLAPSVVIRSQSSRLVSGSQGGSIMASLIRFRCCNT